MHHFPKDIENIILNYKKEFENYDTQFEKINHMIKYEKSSSIKINMNYLDLKEFLIKKNIYSIRYKVPIFGEGHENNSAFWDLDFIEDEDYILENYRVREIRVSNIYKMIYIKLE